MSNISEIAEIDRKRKSWIFEKQPELTLYYHPVSPPARMILFFLLELNGLVLKKKMSKIHDFFEHLPKITVISPTRFFGSVDFILCFFRQLRGHSCRH